MPEIRMIFDAKKSMRTYDDNGYLHVAMTPISKACVNPYVGREIPDWYNLDLQPDRIYYGLRDPEELKKGAQTFNGLPLLMDHHPIDSERMENREYIVGSTGTDAMFDGKYLKNSLAVHDAAAIRLIEDGSTKEISCAYRFVPDFTPGTFEIDGSRIHYDFVMRRLSGNHVALVAEGRAGHDVAVADSLPKEIRKENGNVRTRKITRKVTRRILAADSRKKKVARDSVDSLILEFAPNLDEEHRAAFKAALAVAHQAAAEGAPALGSASVIDEEPVEVEEEVIEEAVPEEETAEPAPEEEAAEEPVGEDDDDAVNEKVEEAVEEVLEGKGKPEEAAEKLAENLDEAAEDTDEDVEEAVEAEEEEPAEDAEEKVDIEALMQDPKFKAGFEAGLAARKAYNAFQAEAEDAEPEEATEEGEKIEVLDDDGEEIPEEEKPAESEEEAEDAEIEEEEPDEDAEEETIEEEVTEEPEETEEEEEVTGDSSLIVSKLLRTAKYALDGKMISRGKAAEKFGAFRIRKWTAEAAECYREDPRAHNDYWTTQGALRITFDSKPRAIRHVSSGRKKEPVFDSRTVAELKARVAEDTQKRCRELNEAAARVKPLIGTVVDPLAYDSAEDIYAIALKQAGKDISRYARSSYKDMVDVLVDSKPSYLASRPAGGLDDKYSDCFKYLKNITK